MNYLQSCSDDDNEYCEYTAYEDAYMDSLRQTSNNEFLSLYWKDKILGIVQRFKKRDFLVIRDISFFRSKLNHFCFISVFLVAFSYRLFLNVLLLPLKIILTQFFFILFLGYYIKLCLLTSDKELRIPNLQEFTKSNFALRRIFRDITFEPLPNNNRQNCQDLVNKRRQE